MKFFIVLTTVLLLLFNPVQSAEGESEIIYSHIPTPVSLIVNEIDIEEIEVENSRPEIDIPLSEDLQEYIWDICQEYEVSYELVLAIIMIESEFQKDAVSYNKSSLGLMQLNKNTYPELAKDLKIKKFNPFNAKHNVKAGIYYLAQIREELREKDYCDEEILPMMLITYHRGRTGAKRYVRKHGTSSKYVSAIIEQKYEYEKG